MSQLHWPPGCSKCSKVCPKHIFYWLIAPTGQEQALEAKVEKFLNCLLWVDYFPFELTIKLIQNGHTITYSFCSVMAQWFAQCCLILEDTLQKHSKLFIHLSNTKTEKSTEVFQKEKHRDSKIFIAKWWIKDEVLRDKDYKHETSAAVLINEQKLNGCWVPLKNVVSTSNRGDNSLFCLVQKNLTYMSCYNAALQICKPLCELQIDDTDKNFHLYITKNHLNF